jgi:uncharacterized membrane protein
MIAYPILKWIHVLSSTVLFGTGLGIAYFKWATDRTRDVRAIRIASEKTVLADWLFTTPAVVIQPATGLAIVAELGYPLRTPWLLWSILLYFLAGACWIPVVWIQLRMRGIARKADSEGRPLPPEYERLRGIWLYLGVPAFSALILVFWLMVVKPSI